MTATINKLKQKYHETWMKLLKASTKRNEKKMQKHEKALIQLELELKKA